MAITISFSKPLNSSLQIGDTAYHCSIINTNATGGLDAHDATEGLHVIGTVTAISPFDGTVATITCDTTSTNHPAAVGDFVFFSKDPVANIGRLKGYFARARFKTNFTVNDNSDPYDPEQQKAVMELYAVSSEIYTSSK
tara:strand:+ start:1818 stop:2234 length:417 start_codon:yes stop_codon:yes gene_type:complete